jgi:hypothetical protein
VVKRREVYDKVKNIFWAAAFAVVLWLVMVQSQQQTRTAMAEFEVIAPPRLNVAYSPENKKPRAPITVKGSPAALMQLPQTVLAIHEMPKDTSPGHYQVLFRNFNFGTLPAGIDVDTASLIGDVTVDLDKVEEKRLPIHPSLDLTNLPTGWEVARQEVDPPTWRASGPEDVMKKQGQQLTTAPVVLADVLDVYKFDPLRLEEQALEIPLELRKPTDAPKINFASPPEHRPVLLRVTLRPKQREVQIEIPPTFVFSGPRLDGFAYRLEPSSLERIKLTIAGPDDDLREGQLEATKGKIFALIRLDKLVAEIREGKTPSPVNTFEFEVITPPEIKVVSPTDAKDRIYRVKIAPAEPTTRPGSQ